MSIASVTNALQSLRALSDTLTTTEPHKDTQTNFATLESSFRDVQRDSLRRRAQPPTEQMAAHREPITCHVLDTTTGTPAANVAVVLQQLPVPSSQSFGAGQEQGVAAGTASPSPLAVFGATTNGDGRVTAWIPTTTTASSSSASSSITTVSDILASAAVATTNPPDKAGATASSTVHWKLTFNTGPHFTARGITPFFPSVDIVFATDAAEEGKAAGDGPHWHVPLLVGPFNYTTYRGS